MIKIAALAYLIFPILIFILNWTNLAWKSFTISMIALTSIKISKSYLIKPIKKISWSEYIIMISIAFTWVWLSGIGGYAFQNWDFQFRNAVLHDLINFAWPVYYDSAHILSYYFTFWLPSALVGKMLGWNYACLSLFCWSVIGISLTFLLANNDSKMRVTYLAIFFILFSGMDVFGYFIDGLLWHHHFIPKIGEHIETWAEYLIQYSSFTTQLFWVFNQAIPTWIACMLLMDETEPVTLVTIWSLTLSYSPFCFIGTTPFIMSRLFIMKYKSASIARSESTHRLKSLQYLIAPLAITLTFGLFFLTSDGISKPSLLFKVESMHRLVLYFIFCIIEFGAFAILAHTKNGPKQYDLMTATGTLFAIPLIMISKSNDFCMRASIPALVFLFMSIIQSLQGTSLSSTKKVILGICLLIGAITPLQEISRSFVNGVIISDNLKGFNKINPRFDLRPYIKNFVSKPIQNTVYQKWIAPK